MVVFPRRIRIVPGKKRYNNFYLVKKGSIYTMGVSFQCKICGKMIHLSGNAGEIRYNNLCIECKTSTIHSTPEGIESTMRLFIDALKKASTDDSSLVKHPNAYKFYYKLSDKINLAHLIPSILRSMGTRVNNTTYAIIEKECDGPFDYEKLVRENAIDLAQKLYCDIKYIMPVSEEEFIQIQVEERGRINNKNNFDLLMK